MIETERLLLRPFAERDRPDWARMVEHPDVAAWLGADRVRDPAYFDGMLGFWAEHGHGPMAVVRRADGLFLGRVGLRRVPMEWAHPMSGEVEVGWSLARDAWGAGYATEAARALLPWGRARLGVDRIWSWTDVDNIRSQAVMRRLGMVRAPDRDFAQPGDGRPFVVYLASRVPSPLAGEGVAAGDG